MAPSYKVHAETTGGCSETYSFYGPQAFSEAMECLEAMRADRQVCQLLLIRKDGDRWEAVGEALARNSHRDWEEEPADPALVAENLV